MAAAKCIYKTVFKSGKSHHEPIKVTDGLLVSYMCLVPVGKIGVCMAPKITAGTSNSNAVISNYFSFPLRDFNCMLFHRAPLLPPLLTPFPPLASHVFEKVKN